MQKRYIFREIKKEEISQFFSLIRQRIAWMEQQGIRQWNDTGYEEEYPQAYYEAHRQKGQLFVLEDPDTEEIVSGGGDMRGRAVQGNFTAEGNPPDGGRERSGKMIAEQEQRLEAFEKMLRAVEENYETADQKMKKLKAEGREKSATYRQLMGNKMQYQNMLSMYQIYGLR